MAAENLLTDTSIRLKSHRESKRRRVLPGTKAHASVKPNELFMLNSGDDVSATSKRTNAVFIELAELNDLA